jgi:long-chain acyl-CoA synthetase
VNLTDLLHATAERHPLRPAVSDVRSGHALTYDALAREADRVAMFLRAQGLERGQRVGLWAPNNLAYLPAAFGLLGAGACVVPLATSLAPVELARVLCDVGVNACLAASGAEPLPTAGARHDLTDGTCQGFTFEWVDRGAEPPAEFPGLDPAFIRFTSGTTAQSRGVVLSHAATCARVEAADRVLAFTPEDRVLWVLPLAYHFAVTIVAYVKAGAQVLMCPDTRPRAVAEAIRRFEASVLYASPFHFESLGNLGRTSPLRSVRLALSTSAPITEAVMRRFEERFGVAVAQAYGIIEAGLPCINTRAEGLPATSVGRPVPGYDVAVFADDGTRVGAGVRGEIGVRGPGLFSAYYAPWQRVERVTRDGWFLTGDIGHVDERHALYLEGRKKSVIFVAGVKFFPEEVEECLNQFPGVVESRVLGFPHPRLGQVPRAEVVVAEEGCDVAALRAHCARALAPYKIPVEFAIVPAIPRTPGGKILRR